MKIQLKKSKDEFIALSPKDVKYKIRNPFGEEVIINKKKNEIKIIEEDGLTFVLFNNKKYFVEILEKNQNKYEILVNGVSYQFSVESPISYERKKYLSKLQSQQKTETIRAPMPGKILDLMVEENAEIKEGEPVVILEAMKMQNEISSHVSGKVKKIYVKQNDTVAKDEVLVEIEIN